MTRQEINQALEKQLKILADKSATGAADLASLAGAAETMLHISEFLYRRADVSRDDRPWLPYRDSGKEKQK